MSYARSVLDLFEDDIFERVAIRCSHLTKQWLDVDDYDTIKLYGTLKLDDGRTRDIVIDTIGAVCCYDDAIDQLLEIGLSETEVINRLHKKGLD